MSSKTCSCTARPIPIFRHAVTGLGCGEIGPRGFIRDELLPHTLRNGVSRPKRQGRLLYAARERPVAATDGPIPK
eukprot:1402701-Prymnesium_polylepis.1